MEQSPWDIRNVTCRIGLIVVLIIYLLLMGWLIYGSAHTRPEPARLSKEGILR